MFSNLGTNQKAGIFGQSSQLPPSFSNQSSISFNIGQQKSFFESQTVQNLTSTNSMFNVNRAESLFVNVQEKKLDPQREINVQVNEQETSLDPYISELEKKQKLIQQAKQNKNLRTEIMSQEDILKTHPKLQKIDEAINKVIQQTDQFISLIQCKEENYLFPKRIETIQGEIQKIQSGIKYGNNTSQFQKTLNEMGFLCWETSNKLEQVEIEIKRIEKLIKESDQDQQNNSFATKDKKQINDQEQNKKRLENLDIKLNHLKSIFEEFNKNIEYINNSKEINEKQNLEKMLSNISIVQQDALTQCFEQSTLDSKIQDQANSDIQLFLNQKVGTKFQVLENMIISRFKELHEKVIQLDLQLIDNKQKQKEVKGRIDLDLEEEDSLDQASLQQDSKQDSVEHNLLHFSYIKSQQEKENPSNNKNRIQDVKLAGRVKNTSADEKKPVSLQKQKKEIEFDLDDNFSSDLEQEETSSNQRDDALIDSFQIQKNFTQCQSSIMYINTFGAIKFNETQKEKIDEVQFKIQCDNSKISIPHNIKFRENLFKSLKNSKKFTKSQEDKEIYLGEQHYLQKKNIIVQNQLTALQYEHLGREAIAKDRIQTIVSETSQTNNKAIANPNSQPQSRLPPKLQGELNAVRMVTSIKEGRALSPKTDKIPNLMVNTRNANSFLVNESEINNPLSDSDSEQGSGTGSQNEESEEEQGFGFLNQRSQITDQQSRLPMNILGNKGVSVNLYEQELFGQRNNKNKQQQQQQPANSKQTEQPSNTKTDETNQMLQKQSNQNTTSLFAQGRTDQSNNQEKQPTLAQAPQQQKTAQTSNTNNAPSSLFKNVQTNADFQNGQQPNPPTSLLQKDTNNQQVKKDQAKTQTPSLFQQQQTTQPQNENTNQTISSLFPQSQAKQQSLLGGLNINTTIQSQNEKSKPQAAALPPSSPPQSQIQKQVEGGLFGQKLQLPKKQEDKPGAQQTSASQTKLGLGQELFNINQKDQQKAQAAPQPPSSPTQSQVTQQTSLNLFGKGVNDAKKAENNTNQQSNSLAPQTLGKLFSNQPNQAAPAAQQQQQQKVSQQQQPQQQKASLPPSSPPEDQVKKETQLQQLDISSLNLNQQPQQATQNQGLFGKFQQKPEAPPAAGEGDKDKNLPPAPSAFNLNSNQPLQQATGGLFNIASKGSNSLIQPQQDKKQEGNLQAAPQQNGLFSTMNKGIGGGLFNQQQPSTDNKLQVNADQKQPNQTSSGLFSFANNNNTAIAAAGQKNNQAQLVNQFAVNNQNQSQDKETNEFGIKKQRVSDDKQMFGGNSQTLSFTQNNQFSLNNTNQQAQNQQNQFGFFNNNQAQQQNQQQNGLNALNFGNNTSLNTQGGLFQTKAPAFSSGNTGNLFGGANTSGNMFGFNQPPQQQQQQQSGFPSIGFGTGNTSLFSQQTTNNQQSNQPFKQDLTKIQFGSYTTYPQQQQQAQQPNQSQNMFSGFVNQGQGSNGLFATGTNQTNFQSNIPQINTNSSSAFAKPRK